MTIEQKAKAYDEALEQARKELKQDLHESGVWAIQRIFPELRESEDERIRKEILDFIKNFWADHKESIPRISNWLAWLEKQKEPLPIPDKFSGLKSLMLQYLQSAANRKDDSEIESDTDLWGRKILDYVWKYSDEQKEPHFTKRNALFDKCVENCDPEVMKKVSDEIDDMLQKEQKPINFVEELKHYLATTPREQLEKEWKEIESFGSFGPTVREYLYGEQKPNYCHYGGDPSVERCKYCSATCSARLTEEQKPAEWSEENEKDIAHIIRVLDDCYAYGKHDLSKTDHENLVGTLKSIHPQLKSEWSDEDEGELQNAIDALEFLGKKGVYESESGYDAALKAASWLKLFHLQPKLDWSKEDKVYLEDALWCVKQAAKVAKDENGMGACWSAERWLKSLSERFNVPPKPEWNKEDDKMLSRCIKSIESSKQFAASSIYEKDKEINWIKSLSERFNLQPNPEWSEEDRLHYANVLEALEYVKGCKSDYDKIEAVKSDIAWLKLLRNRVGKESLQPHWKPSEEQMRCLKIACENRREKHNASVNGDDVFLGLASLYNILKKLM